MLLGAVRGQGAWQALPGSNVSRLRPACIVFPVSLPFPILFSFVCRNLQGYFAYLYLF